MGKSQGPETGKWKSLEGTSLTKRAEEAQVSFPGMASPAGTSLPPCSSGGLHLLPFPSVCPSVVFAHNLPLSMWQKSVPWRQVGSRARRSHAPDQPRRRQLGVRCACEVLGPAAERLTQSSGSRRWEVMNSSVLRVIRESLGPGTRIFDSAGLSGIKEPDGV